MGESIERSAGEVGPPVRNLRIVLEYEGTRYVGWERQKNGVSIQEIVETAIKRITGETVAVHGSGRTDAGVHAEAQVASFKLVKAMPLRKLLLGMNAVMPDDIAVVAVDEAPPDFHARFSAKRKVYRYTVLNSAAPSPLRRMFTYHVPAPLDVPRMAEAAALFVGRRDFSAFAKEADRKKSCVRTLTRLDVGTVVPLIHFTFESEGFLYNMVRIIVGTLIEIGRGKMEAAEIREILEGRKRSQAGPTAPASGLCLVRVVY